MLATQAQLANPKSVFVSPTNNEVYFTDTNHRVRKILNNGNIVTIAGCGKFGFYDDREPAIKAYIYPTCVFVSSENEVYLVDETYHAILKILQSGIMVSIAGHGYCVKDASLAFPTCVFVSSKNEVYICELNNRIRKILGNGNIITIAGNGQEGFSGDGGLAIEAQIYGPDCVFVSNNDEVYFTDCGNNRIRKILRNGIIETIAGNGKPGFNGDGGPAKEAQLNHPKGIFVLNNEVYFSDGCNHRIRKILENGTIITIAGTGQEGFSGDGGPAEEAQLQYPAGIWVSNDEVYIADEYNNRIRKILRNGHIITIAGNGEKDFSKYPHIGGRIYNYKTLFSNLILETLNELSDVTICFQ